MSRARGRMLAVLLFMALCRAGSVIAESQSSPPFERYYRFTESVAHTRSPIGEIMKDRKLGRVPEDDLRISLTLARLYIDRGLHFQAGKILQALLGQNPPEAIAARAWFHLAKSHYHMGYLQQAQQALSKLQARQLPDPLRAEMRHLQALVLMARNEFARAVEVMQANWTASPGHWNLYARFNLAVALIRSGQQQAGLELLEQTSLQPARDEEAKALLDRVNQATGFLLLQHNRPQQARSYLEKVQLQGPYSSLALLGAGWASALSQQYEQALVPWLELQGRDIRDAPVQEVMLSVPYAYERLQARAQAADHYRQAIKAFEQERRQLQKTLNAVDRHGMQAVLSDVDVTSEQAWLESVRQLGQYPATRYMQQLLDDDRFFNGLMNYREARFIAETARQRIQTINRITQSLFERVESERGSGDAREQIKFIEIMAADLFSRAERLKLDAQTEIVEQGARLEKRARQLLMKRRDKIDVYLVQARLALAQNYEHAGGRSP